MHILSNRLIYFVIVSSLLVASHSPALSASIKVLSENSLNCGVELSGKIVQGDNKKLQAVLKSPPMASESGEPRRKRICLDSKGGSYSEAIKNNGID